MKNIRKSKLTEPQRQFLADWGHLVRTYDVSNMAKMFGVTRQAVDGYINSRIKNEKS